MAETYAQAIKAARERYKEAMDEAAWDALRIVDDHGRPLQTVCKDIADDGWNALRSRAQRLAKTAGQTADERARARSRETQRKAVGHAKAVLKDPGQAEKVIASLTPNQREAVYAALDATNPQPVSRPSKASARGTSSEAHNVSALDRLATMHANAQQANGLVDYDDLSEHQCANAEVLIRATEAEIAVWREGVGGGISDEAIRLASQGVA